MGDDEQWPAELEDLDPTTLARYFARECTEDEVAALRAWCEASPERLAAVDRLHLVWRGAHDVKPAWDVERALGEVTRRHAERNRERARASRSSGQSPRRPSISRPASVRWAAAVAALALAGSYATLRLTRSRSPESRMASLASRVYETNMGERASVALRDGSRVTLAPASRLRMRDGYGAVSRDVELVGEAYFEVAHDSARPFRVHTARGIAEDLGTAFAVTAYEEMSVSRVVVASGRVALDSVVLRAGDLGELRAGGVITVQHGIDVAQALAWTNGRLVLDGMTLGDAVVRLSRWYGADIRIGDATASSRRVSATFEDERVSEAIEAIALSLHLRVERRDSVITLYSSVNARGS